MTDTQFVMAKVTKNDIIFIGEEDSEETRSLKEAKIFDNDEKEDFSFMTVETAQKLLKQRMASNT